MDAVACLSRPGEPDDASEKRNAHDKLGIDFDSSLFSTLRFVDGACLSRPGEPDEARVVGPSGPRIRLDPRDRVS